MKFISNPPSMVAAGSVVAAVQGLHLGSSGSFLSCHRLTQFLSKVIKCDPVSGPAPLPCRPGGGDLLVPGTGHPGAWGANGVLSLVPGPLKMTGLGSRGGWAGA